jgi:hypothetical protein
VGNEVEEYESRCNTKTRRYITGGKEEKCENEKRREVERRTCKD